MTLDQMTIIDAADPAHGADEEAGFGCLETVRGGLPLRRLAVDGRITGLLYRLSVTQTFVNVHAEPLEATYIFPMPARAGVTGFRLKIGERIVEGILKERAAARKEYERAITKGYRVLLAEEERPEVFTVRIGNILPGERVTVELELVGPLAVVDDWAVFRFPLVVAPRYIPGVPLESPGVGLGTAPDTDAVPDASRITPPIRLPGQPNPVHLSFRLELDSAGLPLSDLRSSLHVLQLSQTPEGLPVVELTPGAERLDRDVILRFRVGADAIHSSLSLYRDPDGEVTALLTVAPPSMLPATFRPRDVVVLLDRSSSMTGWKILAARRAAARLIDTLTDRDRFGLILFDNQIEEPAPSAGRLIAATDHARFQAVQYLTRVEACGGTHIAPALTRALQYFPDPPDPGRERILLFVTDGQSGNEDQLLRQVYPQAQHCRIFAIGIDRAVNASLLERLAAYGGGHCELIESEDRLDEVLRAVHRRLGAPLLTDVRLEPALEDLAPDATDLFPGVPLRLGGRFAGPVPTHVTVTGRTAEGQPFRQTLKPVETSDPAMRTLWARARVLDLEHRFTASTDPTPHQVDTMIAFSLRYGVLCRFTAFVAVDHSEAVNPGDERRQEIQMVEPPSGWAMPLGVRAAPSFASASRGVRACADVKTASRADWSLEDLLDLPAFLRRPAPAPAAEADAPDEWSSESSSSDPPAPPPTPEWPWLDRLEALLIAPTPDPAALIVEMHKGLVKLEALGDLTAALVTEGRDLIAWLEGDRSEEGRKWLTDWLRRVRELLARPAARRWRRFWWCDRG